MYIVHDTKVVQYEYLHNTLRAYYVRNIMSKLYL